MVLERKSVPALALKSDPMKSCGGPMIAQLPTEAVNASLKDELSHVLKSFQAATKAETLKKSHARKRHAVSQLLKIIIKYSPHLPTQIFLQELLTLGEILLNLDGMHDVARVFCFKRIIDDMAIAIPENISSDISPATAIQTEPHPLTLPETILSIRTIYGYAFSKFKRVHALDPKLKKPITVAMILECLDQILHAAGLCVSEESLAPYLQHGVMHVKRITEVLKESGNADKVSFLLLGFKYFWPIFD